MTMRSLALAVLLAGAAAISATALPAAAHPQAADAALSAAVAGSTRAPASVARDVYRHPGESLSFWGLQPHLTVLEVWPGGGYWTEILAPYAKATGGRYIAAVPNVTKGLPAKFADKAVYGDIAMVAMNKDSGPLAPAGSVDLILTARNVHDWLWTPGLAAKLFKDMYAALKPGGILAVEEHRADPRPQNGDAHDGYMATAAMVKLAEEAGFKLDGASEINANPKDTKDYPFGVWTLKPTRESSGDGKPALSPADRAKYDAIGESDRMTLRFKKPK